MTRICWCTQGKTWRPPDGGPRGGERNIETSSVVVTNNSSERVRLLAAERRFIFVEHPSDDVSDHVSLGAGRSGTRFKASIDDLNKRGGEMKHLKCGPQSRLCVIVDPDVGSFCLEGNNDDTYMIVRGY